MKELFSHESRIKTVCMQEEDKAFEAEGVTVKRQGKTILDGLSLCIYKGQKVAIIGYNGSGKTTCLKCMLGSTSYEGNITFNNYDRGNIGYIPADNLIFRQSTVKENLLMGVTQTDLDRDNEAAAKLPDKDRKCEYLSGGEMQRIMLLRCLIQNREIIFADEPASALNDEMGNFYIRELLNKGKTVVYVTHKPEYAALADRIIMIKDGKAVELDKDGLNEAVLYKEWAGKEENFQSYHNLLQSHF